MSNFDLIRSATTLVEALSSKLTMEEGTSTCKKQLELYEQFRKVQADLLKAHQAIEKAASTAILVSWVNKHPFLEKLSVSVESNSDYDDQGGTFVYRRYTVEIEEYNVALATSVLGEDVDQEIDRLAEELSDEASDNELFGVMLYPNSSDMEDYTFTVNYADEKAKKLIKKQDADLAKIYSALVTF